MPNACLLWLKSLIVKIWRKPNIRWFKLTTSRLIEQMKFSFEFDLQIENSLLGKWFKSFNPIIIDTDGLSEDLNNEVPLTSIYFFYALAYLTSWKQNIHRPYTHTHTHNWCFTFALRIILCRFAHRFSCIRLKVELVLLSACQLCKYQIPTQD